MTQSAIVKIHYSAAELASLKLNDLPSTRDGIRLLAERAAWPSIEVTGRGGIRREYAPPPAVMTQIRARAAQQLLAATHGTSVAPSGGTQRDLLPRDLNDKQRQRETARKAVLNAVEKLVAQCRISKESAIAVLRADAAREPAGTAAMMLQAAEDERGRKKQDGADDRIPSIRTIKRWFAQDKQHALAPKKREKDYTVPSWAAAFLGVYQVPQKPSVELAYKAFAAGWDGDPAELPSVHVVRRFLAKIGNVSIEAGRQGPRKLRSMQAFIRRDTSKLLPNDIWTADGHTFDAEVAHPFTGKPFRPEITMVIDLATRMAVGVSIDLAESSLAILECLQSGWLQYGVPAILYTDNGAYKSKIFTDKAVGILGRVGVTPEFRAPYSSQAGGAIERPHRTIWVDAAKKLPTYMGADMDPEAKLRSFKITRKQIAEGATPTGLLAWPIFIGMVHQEIADYNNRPHSAFGRKKSPAQVWLEHVSAGWEPVALNDAEVGHLCRPREMRKVLRCEIALYNNRYFSNALEEFHGEEVQVGYDVMNPDQVWVYDLDGRPICTAQWNANKRDYMPMSRVEQAREQRAAGRIARAQDKIDDALAERNGRPALELDAPVILPGFAPMTRESLNQKAAEMVLVRAEVAPANVGSSWENMDGPARYHAWLELDQRINQGEELTAEEATRHRMYQKSTQFKVVRSQFEANKNASEVGLARVG